MSDTYRVTYTPQALEDLKEIYRYISFSLKETVTAKKHVARIRNEIRSLSAMPERYVQVEWEPWRSMGMRKVPINNFMVFYLVQKEALTVLIVRILYGGMDIEEALKITES